MCGIVAVGCGSQPQSEQSPSITNSSASTSTLIRADVMLALHLEVAQEPRLEDGLGHYWHDGQWYSTDGQPYFPDGLGHFWRYGAWYNGDGTLWAPYVAPSLSIPWFVPERMHVAYLQCLANPERYAAATWSATVDWPLADAAYIRSHEGGDDLCQFNTQGSGACGPYQLLPCADAYLTWPGQIAGAYAKFLDGGRSFYRHWLQWWG